MNSQSAHPSSSDGIEQFYKEHGIKQYACFSGGFKYHDKAKPAEIEKGDKPALSRQALFNEFGLSKKGKYGIDPYKMDGETVPQTKSELADRLMEKIQHQMKKMKYYRSKYSGQ